MYEEFYGLKAKPFSLLPDPAFLYMSEQHSTALTMLEYGLHNQAGFTVITGGVGCGKTTLIHYLIDRLQQDITLGLITNTHKSFDDLLQWVLLAFDLKYANTEIIERYQAFTDFLFEQHAMNRRCVLIVDEAQNLGPQTLEELRMLSNVNTGKDQLLQLILVGQPQLLEFLRRPELYQFAQRVVADYYIEPLDLAETHAYIRHRVSVVGGSRSLFRKDAYRFVHQYSKGIPRLINLICDTALVYGYAAKRKIIGAEIIREVVIDRIEGKRIWRNKKIVQRTRDSTRENVRESARDSDRELLEAVFRKRRS